LLTTIQIDLIGMEGEHVFDAEEVRHGSLLHKPPPIIAELAIDLVKRGTELLLPLLVANRHNHNRVAIGRQFQGRVGRDLKHQNQYFLFVDDQQQASALMRKLGEEARVRMKNGGGSIRYFKELLGDRYVPTRLLEDFK